MLREAHEDLVEHYAKDERKRRDAGAPMYDGEDWQTPCRAHLDEARAKVGEDDASGAHEALAAAVACAAPAVRRVADREPSEDYAGISVRFRVVTRAVYLTHIAALDGVREEAATTKDYAEVMIGHQGVLRDFVAVSVSQVLGFEDEDGGEFAIGDGERALTADDLDFLDANGLIEPLFATAKRFQELGAQEKKVCGSRPPSTSRASDATSAPPSFEGHGDATGERVSLGSPAPSTSPTPAPAESPSASLGSPTSTASGQPQGGGLASTA